jgi:hypothetical protein
MTLRTWTDSHGRLVREWSCCAQTWQLIVTARTPERWYWQPTCLRCHPVWRSLYTS